MEKTREENLESAEEVFGGNERGRIDRSKKDKKRNQKGDGKNGKGIKSIKGKRMIERELDGEIDDAILNNNKSRRVFKNEKVVKDEGTVVKNNLKGEEKNIDRIKIEGTELEKDLVGGLNEFLEYSNSDSLEKEKIRKRKSADVIVKRIDKYEKLNLSDEELKDKNNIEKISNEKLKEEAKKVLEDLVVHGRLVKNEKTGEFKIVKNGDLDVKASLYLFKLAGVNLDKVEYVAPGDYREGKVNVDTGEMDGVSVLEDGTVFIDHHWVASSNQVSATQHTYDFLKDLGFFEDEEFEYLGRMVKFINQVDNFNYPQKYFKNYFEDSWKTLIGINRMLSEKDLEKFFKYKDVKGKTISPDSPMSIGLLKKFGFIFKKKNATNESGKALSQKETVSKSKERLEEMERDGFVIDSKKYGKICLNIDSNLPGGIEAAKAFGCGLIVNWFSNGNGFFISSLEGKGIEDKFPVGKNIRKTMWVNPSNSKKGLSLDKILKVIVDDGFEPSGKLKEFLSTNLLEDLSSKDMHGVELEVEKNDLDEKMKELLGVKESLANKFKDFVLKNRGELEFNKKILKIIHVIDDDIAWLKKIEASDDRKMDLADELIKKITELQMVNWNEELEEYKQIEVDKKEAENVEVEKVGEVEVKNEFGLSEGEKKVFESLTEKEKQYVGKISEKIPELFESGREMFDWEDFPQGRIDIQLENNAIAVLMELFKNKNKFADTGMREKVAEIALKIYKNKK